MKAADRATRRARFASAVGVFVAASACAAFYVTRREGAVVVVPEANVPDVVAGVDANAIRPAVAEQLFVRSAADDVRDAEAPASPADDAAPVEMQPLASTDSSEEIAFEVDAVMGDAVTREVAEEVVVVAKKLWHMHQVTKRDPTTSKATLAMDRYVFAVWPDLATLVSDGKVGVEVRRTLRTRTDIGTGATSYAYSRDDERLAVSFHTPNFAVSFRMGRGSGAPELFGEIVAQVERERAR